MSHGDSPWPRLATREAREVDVVGIGQSSLDHVCLVDGLPEFAGKARMQGYTRLPGGQIATAMLACSRLGLRAAFAGAVGDDEAGELVLAPLRTAGVDLADVAVVPGAPTQLAVILVDRASGERTVLWHRDPRLALVAGRPSRERIARGRVLHVDGGDPEAAAWAAKVARESGVAVVLDADTASPGLSQLIGEVDFPVVSQSFARSYFGTDDVRDALRGLRLAGARMAVVTLGDVGAIARIGERVIASPGFRVVARDTTGAGDAFHAAFVWALCAGLEPEAMLRAANAAAALNCRALGAQGGLPTRAELEAFLAGEREGPWRGPEPS